MRILNSIILSTCLFLFSFNSFAVDYCSYLFDSKHIEMLGGKGGYGYDINFSHYEKSKSILLLSDASNNYGFSIGEQLARKFPQKDIVISDFRYKNTSKNNNVTSMHLDNTKEMPFADNSYDTIVMRRGLCVCSGNKACGGFCSINEESYLFFRRVIKTLNKKNKNSIAILHGEHGTTKEVQDIWKGYLERLEEEFSVQVSFAYSKDKETGLLNSIIIRPAR